MKYQNPYYVFVGENLLNTPLTREYGLGMMAKNHKVKKNILFLKERIQCRERRHTKEEVTVTSLIPKTTHISHIPNTT